MKVIARQNLNKVQARKIAAMTALCKDVFENSCEFLRESVRRINLHILPLFCMMIFGQWIHAQNLMNTGAINNNGRLRVKDQVTGLPGSIDGVFDYFGANQAVPAIQYRHLMLTGSGMKTTAGGSFSVLGDITVARSVTLSVLPGTKITLEGSLDEQGYLLGCISKQVDVTGVTTSSNFGNIGLTISCAGMLPGLTTVTRTSGVACTGYGDTSILRHYNIASVVTSAINATLVFRYSDNELNGRDPRTLELWRSPDGGATWRRQGGTVDTSQKVITISNVRRLGRWTASDPAHLIGPAAYEWVPANLALVSRDRETATVGSTVSSFVLAVTDAYGNPLSDVPVHFGISSAPVGATMQNVSVITDTTDDNGVVSTVLTLGTKVGTYCVSATSPALPGVTVRFNGTASVGAVASVLPASGDAQVGFAGAVLPQPLVLSLVDFFGNAVPGVKVQCAIIKAPQGAMNQQLSWASTESDSAGQARVWLRLGDFPGTYTVTGTVQGIPPAQLSATATVMLADVNSDFDVNIADLTTVIDHLLHRVTLTRVDSIKGDVNRDGTISVKDVQGIQSLLLGSAQLNKGLHPTATFTGINASDLQKESLKEGASAVAHGFDARLEISPAGTSFNIDNAVPIKGVQLFVRLKNPTTVTKTDFIFERGKMMDVSVSSQERDIRVVAYNASNTPIDSGHGSVFRLPLNVRNPNEIDSVFALVSIADTVFDVAVQVPVSVVRSKDMFATMFELFQNYPNPFNPSTTIRFSVPHQAHVTLKIYNILGQEVATLVSEEVLQGFHTVEWNATGVASGAYFYRMEAGDYNETMKLLVVK